MNCPSRQSALFSLSALVVPFSAQSACPETPSDRPPTEWVLYLSTDCKPPFAGVLYSREAHEATRLEIEQLDVLVEGLQKERDRARTERNDFAADLAASERDYSAALKDCEADLIAAPAPPSRLTWYLFGAATGVVLTLSAWLALN